jgi:drug/metabolite transporter (DMT)-like permease
LLSILFGLTSAAVWGAGDFTGGLASRKTGAYRAVVYGEMIGLIMILVVALIVWQPVPKPGIWALSMLAGAFGTMGILLLYYSMTKGLMSIAAPISALLAALLPVIIGIFTESLPTWLTFIGFAFALAAIWLISQSKEGVKDLVSHITDLRLPLLAGVGFGTYFVLINAATHTATLWPMVASRVGGILILVLYMIVRRETWKVEKDAWSMIFINGILDIGGNLFFVLAGQVGRLDISAVLSSLYPGSTVILAWIFLKERLSRTQWIGIIAAMIAIILFTI